MVLGTKLTLSNTIFKTTSFRFTILYLFLFSLSVLCFFSIIYFVTKNTLRNELEVRILDEINYLSHEYKEDGLSELIEETEERIEKAEGGERLYYFLQNQKGKSIFII